MAELAAADGLDSLEAFDQNLSGEQRERLFHAAFDGAPTTVQQEKLLHGYPPFTLTVIRLDEDQAIMIITQPPQPLPESPVVDSHDLTLILDADGKCLDVTIPDRASELMRHTQLIDRYPKDYLPPMVADNFAVSIQRAFMERRPQTFNFELNSAKGKLIYEARFIPFSDRVVCLLHDHTDWFSIQDSLSLSEEKFEAFFSNAPLGLVMIDRDFRIVKHNSNLEQITGYSASELRDSVMCDLTCQEDVKRCRQLYLDLFDHKISKFEAEKRFCRKNGEITWVSVTVTLIMDCQQEMALEIIEEISRRKNAESMLQQAEDRLQELKSVARVGYWQYDHHSKNFSCDHELLQLLGYGDAHADLNLLIRKSIVPEDRFRLARNYSEAIKNHNDINMIHRILDASGQTHYFFQRGRTEFSPDGKPSRTIGMSYDVSEIQQANNRLEVNNRIFEALVAATQRLLEVRLPLMAFGDLLHSLGNAFNADRACYFELSPHRSRQSLDCHLSSEFVQESTASHPDPASFHALINAPTPLQSVMQDNRPFLCYGDTHQSLELTRFMRGNRIRAFLAAPIFVQDALSGIIAIEDCTQERQWSESEIDGLKIFTETIGLVLNLRKRESELQTAKEKAEKNELLLKKNELRFKNLIAALPDTLYVHNRAGYILDYHAANPDDLPMPPDKFLGRHVREVHPPFLADKTIEEINNVLRTGKMAYFQYELSSGDEILSYDARLLPYGQDLVLAIIRNVTELQKMRHALLNSEAKFKQLFERMISGAAIFEPVYDHRQNLWRYRFVDVNPAYERMTGSSRQPLLDQFIDELFPTDYSSWMGSLHEVATTGESKVFQLYHHETDRYYYCSAFKPERIKKHFCVIFNDITAQKKTEEELIRARDKAEESDRLKSSFLSNMSHEIRTPLNTIVGLSNLLAEHQLSEPEKKQYATLINQSSTQLLTLISDIIDIARIENGQLNISSGNVKVNDICDKLYEIFQKRIEQQPASRLQLILRKELSDEQSVIATDETRLTQILTNLLGNALKFTPYGHIEFGYHLLNNRAMLQFYVKDTGPGIPAAKQQLIFERFRQADESFTRQYGGAGLGLSISKNLVELMGGNIWIKSTPGHGTSFFFTLPYFRKDETESEKIRRQPPPKVQENRAWPGKTVLIVDDTPTVQFYLKTLLEMVKITCLIASNGHEAVEICRNNPNINLVLMDIQMPIMNGYEATAKIKKLRRDLPVIAQTAYAFASDQERIMSAGCDDLLTKPVRKDTLLSKLAELFN